MKDLEFIIQYLFACVILLIGLVVLCVIFASDRGNEIENLEQQNTELRDSITYYKELLQYD